MKKLVKMRGKKKSVKGGGNKGYSGLKANNTGKKLPDSDSKLKHIFRDAEGHLPDTSENRRLLQETTKNPQNYLGKDKYGNDWYAATRKDGSQVWVQSRNGEIWDGGLNKQAREWNVQTGLKNQGNPKNKK